MELGADGHITTSLRITGDVMDVITFVSELLNGLSSLEKVQVVTTRAEGPTVRGRANFGEDLFLAFYYNQVSGTQAFALVRDEQRIWGIDYDNRGNWHEHPVRQPDLHITLEKQTMYSVIQHLKAALSEIAPTNV